MQNVPNGFLLDRRPFIFLVMMVICQSDCLWSKAAYGHYHLIVTDATPQNKYQ
jgi:hypothetical protein